jgi:hypothetical protein
MSIFVGKSREYADRSNLVANSDPPLSHSLTRGEEMFRNWFNIQQIPLRGVNGVTAASTALASKPKRQAVCRILSGSRISSSPARPL